MNSVASRVCAKSSITSAQLPSAGCSLLFRPNFYEKTWITGNELFKETLARYSIYLGHYSSYPLLNIGDIPNSPRLTHGAAYGPFMGMLMWIIHAAQRHHPDSMRMWKLLLVTVALHRVARWPKDDWNGLRESKAFSDPWKSLRRNDNCKLMQQMVSSLAKLNLLRQCLDSLLLLGNAGIVDFAVNCFKVKSSL